MAKDSKSYLHCLKVTYYVGYLTVTIDCDILLESVLIMVS